MRSRRIGTHAVALLCASGAFALTATPVAQASDATVRAAIKKVSMRIKASPALKRDLAKLRNPSKESLKSINKLITKLHSALERAARKVRAQRASTTRGSKGRRYWLHGVRKLARGLLLFRRALRDGETKSVAAMEREMTAAKAKIAVGLRDVKKGEGLLSLKRAKGA